MILSVWESELIRLSQTAGSRTDWVQAGGGNTSIKDKDQLLIKASGMALRDLSAGHGIAKLSLGRFWEEFDRSVDLKKAMAVAIDAGSPRPSIETILHVQMQKVTLHTHPVLACSVLMHPDYQTILRPLFPESVFVDYYTPGFDLGMALKQKLGSINRERTQVFLQNHGVIFSGPDVDSVLEMALELDKKLQPLVQFDIPTCKFDMNALGLVSLIQASFTEPVFVSPVTDSLILGVHQSHSDLLFHTPFSPDILVYCGHKPLRTHKNSLREDIQIYCDEYGTIPRVILCDSSMFVIGKNPKKAQEVEDVLRFFCLCLMGAKQLGQPNTVTSSNKSLCLENGLFVLSPQELDFLSQWESEKYRRSLGEV